MLVNVYTRNKNGDISMEQITTTSIRDAVEIVCSYLDDGSEVIFAEDNLNPIIHNPQFDIRG